MGDNTAQFPSSDIGYFSLYMSIMESLPNDECSIQDQGLTTAYLEYYKGFPNDFSVLAVYACPPFSPAATSPSDKSGIPVGIRRSKDNNIYN